MTDLTIPTTPIEMGFKGFPFWRPHQRETVKAITRSSKKIFMLDAPCGSGKSITAMATAKKYPQTIYLCTTKMLQDQLRRDFPDTPILMGRNNYKCLYNANFEASYPEVTADDCPWKHVKKGKRVTEDKRDCKGVCPYLLAKQDALHAPVAILNTTYFLIEANFVGEFSRVPFIVIDETDELEDQLMRFVEITITQRMLDRLHLDPPQYKTKFESWKEWAKEILPHVQNEVVTLERSISDPFHDRMKLRAISYLKNLIWKLNFFTNTVDKYWVQVEGEGKWTWKPIWVSQFGKEYIFDHGDKFLLMSATILSPIRLSRNLGIERDEWEYKSIPSQFPPENRKVVYNPIANISNKTKQEELPKIIPAINNILTHHKGEKGLIHTVSYSNAKYILDNVKDGRLLIHGSKDRSIVLQKFISSEDSAVLISPSMDRGLDLPYDRARFQIIIKVPFPDIGDKQIAARLYSGDYGRQWYAWVTACTIVQMSGRSTRAEDDWSVVYILDSNFGRFYGENAQLFPGWWKESLEVEE